MTEEERVDGFCRFCKQRQTSYDGSVTCQLTQQKPDFEIKCRYYHEDRVLKKRLLREDKIRPLAKKGERKLIILSGVFVLLSLVSVILTFMSVGSTQPQLAIRSVLRFVLECGLLYGLYQGNYGVKIVMAFLLFGAAILGLYTFFELIKYPIIAVFSIFHVIFYLYFFIFVAFDKQYSAFSELQKEFYD
jgi:hypothetical protein